jgi:hypothetical protein
MLAAVKAFAFELWMACKLDRLPLLICGIFICVALGLLRSRGVNGLDLTSVLLNSRLFLICIAFALSISFLWSLIRERPASPIAFGLGFLNEKLHWSIITRHAPTVIALCVFMPVFSAMKASISLFADYSWDAMFTRWDQTIHWRDAWKLIHPVTGFPIVTFTLNLFYNFWIVAVYAATAFLALRLKDPRLRQKFLITYFSCWPILGVAGAIYFASVGPAFVGPLLGQAHFDPLMAYLGNANEHYRILSVEVQAKLVEQFREGSTGLGAGITAMPSMHVSMALLFFLAMRKFSRVAAWLSGLFFIAILVGSVHLAYHYAVDGYVSIVVTLLIWKLAGWWTGLIDDATKAIVQARARHNTASCSIHEPCDIHR